MTESNNYLTWETVQRTVKSLIHFFFLTECQTQADIAFLLDGSGSVHATDF